MDLACRIPFASPSPGQWVDCPIAIARLHSPIMPVQPHHRIAACSRFVALLLLTGLSGCRSGDGRSKLTRVDRMMTEYPSLHTGRFVIVADFEDPKHMELVTFRATTPTATFAYDARHGRPETGTGCLKVTASNAEDTVILSNLTASTWYLKRDWRAFDTMLMAIHAPRRGLSADITIRSGPEPTQAATSAAHHLQEGWNILRLDLAEIAEQIAIDDIRAIHLSFLGINQPTEMYIDDLLLTADREMVFGDFTTDGTPYVRRVSDRLLVGTGGAFELTFAHGQIVSWFDLRVDSHRLHNLVRGTTLGPRPIVLDASNRPDGDFKPLGSAVLAEQRLLEANAVRIRVECAWRFVDDPEGPIDGRPLHRRVYTIYPTGQMFVTVEATIATDTWQPPRVGLAVRMAPSAGEHVVSAEVDPSHPTYGWLAAEGVLSSLVFAVETDDDHSRLMSMRDESSGVCSLVHVAGEAGETVRWRCLLWLTTSDKGLEESARARVAAFDHPPALDLQVGSLDSGHGTAMMSGFDRETGSFFLKVEDGRVRFKLRPTASHAVEPAFTVTGTAGHQAWVYVNHILHEPTARNRDGDVIFQLREPIRKATLVEVIVRRGSASSGS